MLRWLMRLTPPTLFIMCTPSGVRRAVASTWVAGYGGIRSSSSVAALSCTMLRCLARQCSLSLQIVSTRRCAFALRWFCFPQNPGHFFLFTYLVILFIYFRARHSSALSFWVQQHEIIKVPGTIYHSTTRNITENSIRRYLLSLSWVAVQIWLLFRIVQCCGVWHGCARSPALSLLTQCTRRCNLVKLLDTAVPDPSLGLLF